MPFIGEALLLYKESGFSAFNTVVQKLCRFIPYFGKFLSDFIVPSHHTKENPTPTKKSGWEIRFSIKASL
ncbi:MAG: hypothetical protein II202_06685, partial [Bacteroidales bacterium]|nr:hypothetical protein [Bacteroidales bacterium]